MLERVQASIICTNGVTLSISNHKEVYSMGRTNYGENGHEENITIPTIISRLQNIKSISCGRSHSMCLDSDGNVFTFGYNQDGQTGTGKKFKVKKNNFLKKIVFDFTNKPQKVDLPPIKQISSGESFNMCVSESGEVYAFGCNMYGELGLGHSLPQTTPKKIEILKDVDFVDCGSNHTFCKTLNDEIFCWGRNCFGSLGLGNSKPYATPVKCEDCPKDIIDIKCGHEKTFILTLNHEVYSCGNNENNQLGRDTLNGETFSPTFQKNRIIIQYCEN